MTKKKILKFLAMLCLGLLIAGAWFISSASLLIIKNGSPHQLTHTAVRQKDNFQWYSKSIDQDLFLVLVRGHLDDALSVELKFADGVTISESVGYFVGGDILVGYHKLTILKNRGLSYTILDWL